MKFHHLGIETTDLERSISFFKRFGFQVEQKVTLMGESLVFLTLDDFRLELTQVESLGESTSTIHFALEVKDLEQSLEKLGEDIVVNEGPYNLENGWKTVFIIGPNGENIELLQVN
ncbi:VOC family protein [Pseudalkalibacillus decolorationis]|uniref:VOC family protein n=1 Tax=Pseudalkalibacillus decolorationis TaxID=163879 RepID=UPI002147D04F|nr:VOC family protein [Pseudalkalibacillus decolorationis]